MAIERDFRRVFKAPPDIAARYSALSWFGLVPGALTRVDVVELLERGIEMMHASDECVPLERTPGVWLGAALGELAAAFTDGPSISRTT